MTSRLGLSLSYARWDEEVRKEKVVKTTFKKKGQRVRTCAVVTALCRSRRGTQRAVRAGGLPLGTPATVCTSPLRIPSTRAPAAAPTAPHPSPVHLPDRQS